MQMQPVQLDGFLDFAKGLISPAWMRNIPGYNILSEVGGKVLQLYTSGLISPDMQTAFFNKVREVGAKTGKKPEDVTAKDFGDYLEKEEMRKNIMIYGGGAAALLLIFFVAKK